MIMEEGSKCSSNHEEQVVEEEYVLIDLDAVLDQIDIPANAPYVLSGLDTPNPILTIDEKIKLIGEYGETIGTCLVFSETDAATTLLHEEMGPSEANLFSERCIVEPKQGLTKEVKPLTSLHKILKFRLLPDADAENSPDKEMDKVND